MRVLVTGATGFVGHAVSQALLAESYEVLAFVRTPKKAKDLEQAGATLAVGDMLAPETYQPLVKDVEVVVHTAQYGTRGRLTQNKLEQIEAADKTMTEALAQECINEGKRLVYTSGCFNYGDHGDAWITEKTPETPSPLGRGHHALSRYLLELYRQEGLEVVVLAPGFVYGSGGLFKTSFYDTLQKGQLRVFGKGENYWSPVHVEDLAQAYVKATTSNVSGEAINVADDVPLKLRELVDTFTGAAGKPKVGTIPPWLLGFIIGSPLVASLTTSFRVKNSKAKQLLGWTPRYRSFNEGISGVVKELSASGSAA